ncbi:MAG: hypothetical protein JNL11_07640 [Bdellovibrionaceae bacterium]|nr:hypothetical protein [Pseudobdellovibrionaceae bacterium]
MRFIYILFLLFQMARAQVGNELKSKSIPVLAEKKGIIEIRETDFAPGQRMIFIRVIPDYDEFEIIAEGSVTGTKNKRTFIKLKMDKLKKIPTKEDFAVMLGEPKKFTDPKVEKNNTIISLEQEEVKEYEPGYVAFYILNVNGQLKSTSSNVANSLKQVDALKTGGFGLEWYFEFLSSYGFSYESASGRVPVYSYFKVEELTTYEFSDFKILFRSSLMKAPGWRWKIHLSNWTSKFKTTNADAYVLSTQIVSNGLGLMVAYDFKAPLFESPKIWGNPYSLYAGFTFYPDVNVKDGAVSRGETSAGSVMTSLVAGYTHNLNLKFIPYVNRWFVDFRYSQISQSLKMAGGTTSEAGGFYTVPIGGGYTEKQTLFMITLGVRFPDVLGANLKSRN